MHDNSLTRTGEALVDPGGKELKLTSMLLG
jgi:hypothetical protein